MQAGEPSRRWRAASGPLQCRRWCDEVAVYDASTGDTHLLNATAGNILEQLRDDRHAPATEVLCRRLLGNDAPDDNARLMLEETLQRLAQVGLVVAIDP